MKIMTAQASGTSDEFKYVYGTKPFNVFVSGTFDTATVQLQAINPDGVWVDVDESAITAPVMRSVFDRHPFTGRYNILTPGAGTSLTISVVGQIV